ncbi:ATP-dependent Clp protease adapter ClpS [Kocuria sp.]|uniref:ATP-dependent Clp protease adapter ClpS n=1 Tax=Kocuria sp. TaxID=1871328 RepID=UPI0026DA9342|nr:ATP-dependent Clp protease adapter ClpS [Kocuria sp.]MDO4918560.1 ATP-dependent Clp protease adapter ClpS [Kocuria sp.]
MSTYSGTPHAVPPVVLASAAPAESPTTTAEDQPASAVNVPWNVVVWDDPVNLMSYVVYVFRAHFGYPDAKARALMLEVHNRGRSIVFTGSLEEAETHVGALHGYGLWATYEKAGEN